jgi:TatD DNase family protein
MTTELIDTHIHLSAPDYDQDLDQVLERARQNQIYKIITIGAGYGSSGRNKTLDLLNRYPDVYGTLGIHPNEAHQVFCEKELEVAAQHPKVVGIGETGLDYHWDDCPPEQQRRAFILQIKLAQQLKKPLIIHCRKAANDCLKILQDYGASSVGGVFHCYSEDARFASELSKINFLISLTGTLTYKNNQPLRDAVRDIPLEQIMIETDGPYLAPQSQRGKRNESAFLVETVELVAQLKEMSFAAVAAKTTSNALRLFKLE